MSQPNRSAVLPPRPLHWYQRAPWLVLAVVLLAAVVLSAATGSFPVSGRAAFHIIADKALGGWPDWPGGLLTADYSAREAAVVWDIRMPRVMLGVAAGGLIGLGATLLQGAFRNPLADPGLIGISAGGAWLALLVSLLPWRVADRFSYLLPAAGFVGCLLATVLLWRLASHHGTVEVVTLILAGVALQAILTAAIAITTAIRGDVMQQVTSIWEAGGLAQAQWSQVRVALAVLAVGWLLARVLAERLNLLSLGDREAAHLGMAVNATRGGIVLLVAALLAVAVAYAGPVAFVGLIVPQGVKAWLGPDHRRLVGASVLGGAVVTVVADLVARTIAAPIEIGLGIVLAVVGGPLFIGLLLRVRRRQGGWA